MSFGMRAMSKAAYLAMAVAAFGSSRQGGKTETITNLINSYIAPPIIYQREAKVVHYSPGTLQHKRRKFARRVNRGRK